MNNKNYGLEKSKERKSLKETFPLFITELEKVLNGSIDNAKYANNYLYKLIEKNPSILGNHYIKDGIYKIRIIEKNEQGIEILILGPEYKNKDNTVNEYKKYIKINKQQIQDLDEYKDYNEVVKKYIKGGIGSLNETEKTTYGKTIENEIEQINKGKHKQEWDIMKEFKIGDKVLIKVKEKSQENNKITNKKRIEKVKIDDLMGILKETIKKRNENHKNGINYVKEIERITMYLVEMKNNGANQYLKDFQNWINQKTTHKQTIEEKKIQKTYSQSTDKTKQKKSLDKEKNNEYKTNVQKADKNIETNIKKDIFEVLKRIYNKDITLHQGDDIDKMTSIFLLKICGFFKDKNGEKIKDKEGKTLEIKDIIKNVVHGESNSTGLHIDTGQTATGIKIKNIIKKQSIKDKEGKETGRYKIVKSLFKSKAIIDEHGDNTEKAENTKRPTSSTHIVFDILQELGMLPAKYFEQIKRFVKFVDIVDSLEYQSAGIDYRNSYQTFVGLYRNLKIEEIYNYFENPNNTGFEILSENFLRNTFTQKFENGEKKTISLKEISKQHKIRVEKNISILEEIENEGKILKKTINGKEVNFILDIGNNINDGAQTAQGEGYGIITLYPKTGDLYIYSPRLLPRKILGILTSDFFLIIKDCDRTILNKILKEEFRLIKDEKSTTKDGKETILNTNTNNINKGLNDFFAKRKEIANKKAEEKIQLDFSKLPILKKEELKVGGTFKGIINNKQSSLAFVTLDKNNTIKGVLHKNNVPKELIEKLEIGQEINVKIMDIKKDEKGNLKINLIIPN